MRERDRLSRGKQPREEAGLLTRVKFTHQEVDNVGISLIVFKKNNSYT